MSYEYDALLKTKENILILDRFGRWLLFTVTIICWGAQFSSMSLTSMAQNSVCANQIFSLITKLAGPNRWEAAMALYMIGFISYGATLVFYAALFPRLARNTQHARDLREKYENGEVEPEVYEIEESMEKNRISNISTVGS